MPPKRKSGSGGAEPDEYPDTRYKPGEVRILRDGDPVPSSSLANAFHDAPPGEGPADALVLRGYLGRSDILDRIVAYLERVKAAEGGSADAEDEEIQNVIDKVRAIEPDVQPLIPMRLYLTPNLDRYVDFHRSSVLAVRREPRKEREDTFTVWLRIFQNDDSGGIRPIPYRVVHETNIGPSFSGYLGGDLIDDYLGGEGSSGGAWSDQTGVLGGGKPRTGVFCGRKNTGIFCGE
ncbi:MAG: hypothetical protein JHC74_11895 [Thermoleophilia bacterium]|nr:hypothetical protein [Thermoleophilia bacterium]